MDAGWTFPGSADNMLVGATAILGVWGPSKSLCDAHPQHLIPSLNASLRIFFAIGMDGAVDVLCREEACMEVTCDAT